MKISWVILTYNRANSVEKAIPHCMKNAGREWDEIVWCDNGSSMAEYGKLGNAIHSAIPEGQYPNITTIVNPTNLGVAIGYNNAMALCRGDLIVITGCDMLMPDNWLKAMVDCFDLIPKTGIVSIYAAPIESTPERIRGPEEIKNGILTRPAMPMGRRMFTRKLLDKAGYLREDFGMYGWEDVEWARRAERVCKSENWLCYNLPRYIAEHLGTEGNVGYDHKDEHSYWNWKKNEVNDPKKQELLAWCGANNFPYYNPFDSENRKTPEL